LVNRFARVVSGNHGKVLVSAGRRVFEVFAKIAAKERMACCGVLGVKDDRGEFTTKFGDKPFLRWSHR